MPDKLKIIETAVIALGDIASTNSDLYHDNNCLRTAYNEKKSILERDIEGRQETINHFTKQCESLIDQLEKLESVKKEEIEKSLDHIKVKFEKQVKELESENKELRGFQSSRKGLEQLIKNHELTNKKLNKEIEEIKTKTHNIIETRNVRISHLTKRIHERDLKIEDLNTIKEAYEQTIDIQQGDIKNYSSMCKSYEKNKAAYNATIEEQKKEIEALGLSCHNCDKLKSEIQSIEHVVETKIKEISSLQSDFEKLKKTYRESCHSKNKEISRLAHELNNLNSSIESYNTGFYEKEKENLKKEILETKKESERLIDIKDNEILYLRNEVKALKEASNLPRNTNSLVKIEETDIDANFEPYTKDYPDLKKYDRIVSLNIFRAGARFVSDFFKTSGVLCSTEGYQPKKTTKKGKPTPPKKP